MRVYDYSYVPAGEEHAKFLAGQRRAAGLLGPKPWDDPDFVILGVRVTDLCETCDGRGRVPSKRHTRTAAWARPSKPCPTCKGDAQREVLPTIGGVK